MDQNIVRKIGQISTPEDFASYLDALSIDFTDHKEVWESWTIADYLESISAWVRDFSQCPNNDIDWDKVDFKTIARIFYMGKVYE